MFNYDLYSSFKYTLSFGFVTVSAFTSSRSLLGVTMWVDPGKKIQSLTVIYYIHNSSLLERADIVILHTGGQQY